MIEFICGLLGVLIGVILVYFGYRIGKRDVPEKIEVKELTTEEKIKRDAEIEAYSQWLNYSADQAYMLNRKK